MPIRQPLRVTVPIQRRKILKSSLRGIGAVVLVWGLLTASALGLARLNGNTQSLFELLLSSRLVGAWIALLVIGIAWKMSQPFLYFVSYFYDIDGPNFVIRKGIVAKREVTLPFSRITDVYLDQDVLDVFFGLYDLHISTPTAESGRFAHIDGLDRRGATQLRELVLARIQQDDELRAIDLSNTKPNMKKAV